jgi:hypothetical protein
LARSTANTDRVDVASRAIAEPIWNAITAANPALILEIVRIVQARVYVGEAVAVVVIIAQAVSIGVRGARTIAHPYRIRYSLANKQIHVIARAVLIHIRFTATSAHVDGVVGISVAIAFIGLIGTPRRPHNTRLSVSVCES